MSCSVTCSIRVWMLCFLLRSFRCLDDLIFLFCYLIWVWLFFPTLSSILCVHMFCFPLIIALRFASHSVHSLVLWCCSLWLLLYFHSYFWILSPFIGLCFNFSILVPFPELCLSPMLNFRFQSSVAMFCFSVRLQGCVQFSISVSEVVFECLVPCYVSLVVIRCFVFLLS